MGRVVLLSALLVLGCASVQEVAEGETVLFLVRHAEKGTGADPGLTEEGVARALELSRVLGSAGLDGVYSTDYLRTRETAGPVAQAAAVEVEIYDPSELEAFAQTLKGERGRYLVVGHSNTTPELVGLLGGDPGDAIVEGSEYDRLYVVTLSSGGSVSTVLLRYGASSGS